MSISDRIAAMRTYPYTNARVRAMRADLITDNEYRKLMKMDMAEIAEFLSNRGYGQEIEEYGDRYSGAELLNRAVNRNLSNTYMKLVRIAPEPVEDLLWTYFRKFEIENVKTILRQKMRDRDEDVTDQLFPTPTMDMETLQRYLQMETVNEVLDAVTITGLDGNLDEVLEDRETLPEIEDALDTYYYRQLQETVSDGSKSSDLFQRFLQLEIALTNIQLILRMQRRGYDYSEIMDRILDLPRDLQIVDNDALASANTYDDALEIVADSDIGTYVEDGSPAQVSQALERYKLEQGIELLHKDQLSINPILGFMVCKEIEVSNLQMLVQAKVEGLDEEFMERNLVTGVATE